MPTLGERSHEEVVEITSHLGELPLAPFPALAHLGAAVLEAEVTAVVVLLVGKSARRTQALQVRGEGRNGVLLVTVYSMCVCVSVYECGEVRLLLPLFPSSLSPFCVPPSALVSTCRAPAVNQPAALCPLPLLQSEKSRSGLLLERG